MNESNRTISIRPLPYPRNLAIENVEGVRLVTVKTGKLFVRSARRSQIVVGPSVVVHKLSEPIDIRHDTGSIGRIIDIPTSDLNLIAIMCRGIRLDALTTDGISNFRVVNCTKQAFAQISDLITDAIRRASEISGSRSDDMVRIGCAALLVELDITIEPGSEGADASFKNLTVTEIGQYVREHSEEEFSLGELSDRSGLSPTSFSRAFKRVHGRSLFDYLHRARIQQACLYLKRSDRPVSEIAFEVGYNNISFFNRCFRRIIGTSAVEYRRNSRR